MMQEKRAFRFLLYAGILLCFVLMYFFIVPQSDMFLFARDTQPSLSGAAAGAYSYGNGRFLGNLIAMFLSHRFVLAFLPIALCLGGMVWLVNRLVFSGSVKTILPIAFLIAFPSVKVLGECYYLFAAFVNYVLPLFFALLSAVILKSLGESAKKPLPLRLLLCLVLFASSAAVCLFSENTTVVFVTFSVLWIVAELRQKRTITLHGVCNLLGAGVGALCMLSIPILSQTAHKMDHYRGVATGSLPELIKNVAASFFRFSEVVNSLTLVIALLSAAFLLLLRGREKQPKYLFARGVFAVYPLFSLVMSFTDDMFPYMPITQLVQTVPVLLYAAAILIAVSSVPDKSYRMRCIGFLVLLLSSVGPMLLVTQYGFRTYYTTFVILLVWALDLLLRNLSAVRSILKKWKLHDGAVTAALACAFVFFSGFLFVQSVINFDFFAVRTAYVAEQIEAGTEEVTIPYLPCASLSFEDEWMNIISDILPGQSTIRFNQTIDVSACENREAYEAFYTGSPIYPFRYAAEHLQYKNPRNIHPQF